jgi:hypothetical protein
MSKLRMEIIYCYLQVKFIYMCWLENFIENLDLIYFGFQCLKTVIGSSEINKKEKMSFVTWLFWWKGLDYL